MSDERKYHSFRGMGACAMGQVNCLRLVAFPSGCGEKLKGKSWSNKSWVPTTVFFPVTTAATPCG
jgi:hypothetical protein